MFGCHQIRDIFQHVASPSSGICGCVNIQSVYPNVSPTIRSNLNAIAHPRTDVFSNPELTSCTIMWTRTVPIPQGYSQWIPNHFVPCLSRSVVSHIGKVLKRPMPNSEKTVVDSTSQAVYSGICSNKNGCGKICRYDDFLQETTIHFRSKKSPNCLIHSS